MTADALRKEMQPQISPKVERVFVQRFEDCLLVLSNPIRAREFLELCARDGLSLPAGWEKLEAKRISQLAILKFLVLREHVCH